MKFKYTKQLLGGVGTALSLWLLFSAADAVDELILNTDSLLGTVVFFASPFAMLIYYIIHYIKRRPHPKQLLVWFGSYILCFLPLWYYFYNALNNNTFIVYQQDRSDWLNLNGIEYIFFGFPALIGFTLMCMIFHGIMGIIRLVKIRRDKAM